MIVLKGEENELSSGPSSSDPPPAFEGTAAAGPHTPLLSVVNDHDQLPPPAFSDYQAEFDVTSNGDVVSHDEHLNEDGEAFYRFLLLQSTSRAPQLILRCRGTHTERKHRLVRKEHGNNSSEWVREEYTETITDFSFGIDLSQWVSREPLHWTIPDSTPAYRGKMFKEIDGAEGKRWPTSQELALEEGWTKQRAEMGLPPWVDAQAQSDSSRQGDGSPFKSSRSLREWADDYCRSEQHFKDFIYKKGVFGWNLSSLTAAVRSAILSTHYSGKIDVGFKLSGTKIHIRSSQPIFRAMDNIVIKILMIIFLVYPMLWLYRKFHPSGGGQWSVCGGAYPLKYWKHLEDSIPGEGVAEYSARTGSNLDINSPRIAQTYLQTEQGLSVLVGVKEGEWFSQWERTIKEACVRGLNTSHLLTVPADSRGAFGQLLDGYPHVNQEEQ